MAIARTLDTRILKHPGNIFNAEIKTDTIKMDNAGAVHFIVASETGNHITVAAQVIATDAQGDQRVMSDHEIHLGNGQPNQFIIDADRIARDGHDRVFLKIEDAGEADLAGTVIAILTNERYNTDQSR